MTEADWLACENPLTLLVRSGLWGAPVDRKMRLFLCGCCRLIWSRLPHEQFRLAVEFAERLSDGQANPEEVESVHARTIVRLVSCPPRTARWHSAWASIDTLSRGRIEVGHALRVVERTQQATRSSSRDRIAMAQSQLFRDLFGFPPRPEPFDRAWMSPTAVEMARDIYADRDFDRMPILGDAIEEAGCANPRILEHCRGDGVHARGCWVLDALTGRGDA